MSYLRYLCLLAHSGVQHILCYVLFCFSSSCVPYVVSFSELSFFDCHFGIHYCKIKKKNVNELVFGI